MRPPYYLQIATHGTSLLLKPKLKPEYGNNSIFYPCSNQCCALIWIYKELQFWVLISFQTQRTAGSGSLGKKMWESKNCQPWLFRTPLKNQPFSWKNRQWTGTFVASYLIFPVFLELGLWVFRTMVMNPKNHVDNHQGSVPLSQHLLQFLSKPVFLRARTLEKHIFFWEKVANTL